MSVSETAFSKYEKNTVRKEKKTSTAAESSRMYQKSKVNANDQSKSLQLNKKQKQINNVTKSQSNSKISTKSNVTLTGQKVGKAHSTTCIPSANKSPAGKGEIIESNLILKIYAEKKSVSPGNPLVKYSDEPFVQVNKSKSVKNKPGTVVSSECVKAELQVQKLKNRNLVNTRTQHNSDNTKINDLHSRTEQKNIRHKKSIDRFMKRVKKHVFSSSLYYKGKSRVIVPPSLSTIVEEPGEFECL